MAKLISREYNLDSTAAVKMAVKRFADTESKLEDNEDTSVIWNILSKAKVTIKGDVSIIVLQPSAEALKVVNELEQLVNISVGETLYIIREQTAIVVIIEKDKREKALKLFYKLEIIRIKENATALVVISPADIVNTAGVLNIIVSQFAKNKVNIEEIISCYRDTIIIVDEHDSTKGYQIAKSLTM